MNRRNQPPPQNEQIKGKHKDTMKTMFDTRGRDSERFHDELLKSLDDNKKKYDRSLYSDWITKVYNKCTAVCVKPPAVNNSEDEDP